MGETTPFTPHCPYLGLFILLILGPLELPFPEDGILILGGILVTRSFVTEAFVTRIFSRELISVGCFIQLK